MASSLQNRDGVTMWRALPKIISRKSVTWSAVPVPCLRLKGEQGSGPEEVDDLSFHTYGEFSPSSPGIGPLGWNLGLKAEIWAWRLGGGGYKEGGEEEEEGENSP